MKPRATALGVLWAMVGLVSAAGAQTRAGGEFLVNTGTEFNQSYSAIAGNGSGNFVVAWTDRFAYVKGQRFDAAGTALGAEFNIETGAGYYPGVAMGAKGDFIVVWARIFGDGADLGIMGQRFDANGLRLGAEFVVNSITEGPQFFPRVAIGGGGNFVVSWFTQQGSIFGLGAQRFDAQGNRVGGQFQPNADTEGNLFLQDLSADAAGNFVIAWSRSDASGFSIRAQRFDASGGRRGDEFRVNTYTTAIAFAPGISHAPDGSFLIAYAEGPFGVPDIFAKRYSAGGAPIGAEFQVNSSTSGLQKYPNVVTDRAGSFVVTWSDEAGDGSYGGPRARRFLADGTARGDDFLVNTYTPGHQGSSGFASMIAGDEVGNFVIHWFGVGPVGSGKDVYAQRFGGLRPDALQVDTAGNRVWEPGEAVDVRPAWRNLNGASQTFAATLAALTGPAGGTYVITDGTGNYGTVGNGAAAPCADCYVVSVNDPASRPATHWDATAVERITPDTQGQQKRWSLHIGRSFTDVAATSSFYRFIETLLHAGVTSGCGAAAYCPASSTTREQMSVFVLVAKEGSAYAPPACGPTPAFGDVPASSPFCRWIEELARRGVTGGCGNGNYCPGDAVTREQMAVFVLRTLDPALNPPACTTPAFNDVPASSPFCRWIEELARRGVTGGCGGGSYCPAQPVTREQMAAFLTGTFGLTLYGL